MGEPRSPLRFLAPVALVAFGLTFFAVLTSSRPGADGRAENGAASPRTEPAAGTQRTPGASTRRRSGRRRSYTVKAGDTLGTIAEKTGVSVEELQKLNPDLDPQSLGAGQKLKLRE